MLDSLCLPCSLRQAAAGDRERESSMNTARQRQREERQRQREERQRQREESKSCERVEHARNEAGASELLGSDGLVRGLAKALVQHTDTHAVLPPSPLQRMREHMR
jgi:hypothetical protein